VFTVFKLDSIPNLDILVKGFLAIVIIALLPGRVATTGSRRQRLHMTFARTVTPTVYLDSFCILDNL
jgi:hypothetical protein